MTCRAGLSDNKWLRFYTATFWTLLWSFTPCISYLIYLISMYLWSISFSSLLGMTSIVSYLIFTVHSYVVPTLDELIVNNIIIMIIPILEEHSNGCPVEIAYNWFYAFKLWCGCQALSSFVKYKHKESESGCFDRSKSTDNFIWKSC